VSIKLPIVCFVDAFLFDCQAVLSPFSSNHTVIHVCILSWLQDTINYRHSVVLHEQADAGWETAVAVLKTVLNIAFDTITSPVAMLRMKDFVLLVCSALGESSTFHTYSVITLYILFSAGVLLASVPGILQTLPDMFEQTRHVVRYFVGIRCHCRNVSHYGPKTCVCFALRKLRLPRGARSGDSHERPRKVPGAAVHCPRCPASSPGACVDYFLPVL
jgi:hypothetical protein